MTAFLLGALFGLIGFGYFLYGKRQKEMMPMLVGLALCVYPYFVTQVYLMVLIGVVLMAVPYFYAKWF